MYIFICNLTKTYKYIHLRMRTRTDTPRILRRPEEILEYFSALTCHTFFHMLNAQTFTKCNRVVQQRIQIASGNLMVFYLFILFICMYEC